MRITLHPQNVIDVITNSSSELFIIKTSGKEDCQDEVVRIINDYIAGNRPNDNDYLFLKETDDVEEKIQEVVDDLNDNLLPFLSDIDHWDAVNLSTLILRFNDSLYYEAKSKYNIDVYDMSFSECNKLLDNLADDDYKLLFKVRKLTDGRYSLDTDDYETVEEFWSPSYTLAPHEILEDVKIFVEKQSLYPMSFEENFIKIRTSALLRKLFDVHYFDDILK